MDEKKILKKISKSTITNYLFNLGERCMHHYNKLCLVFDYRTPEHGCSSR